MALCKSCVAQADLHDAEEWKSIRLVDPIGIAIVFVLQEPVDLTEDAGDADDFEDMD